MSECKECGSHAINPHLHGRYGSGNNLCDVCYWRFRHDVTRLALRDTVDGLDADELSCSTGLILERCEEILAIAWGES